MRPRYGSCCSNASASLPSSPLDTLLALVPEEFAPSDERVIAYRGAGPGDPSVLERVGFFVPNYFGDPQNVALARQMPRLQVVQLLTAGFEAALADVPAQISLCNAVGVHDASTAELAVGLIIAALRELDQAARAMPHGRWHHPVRGAALADRRVLVIGAGGVGRAIQRRLDPMEAVVTMVGRTARPGVHGVDALPALLPLAQVVVLAVPLDEDTRGMVDAAFLARLPDEALVVNVSRGPVVHTDALLAELMAGRLRAALDVTDPEPLPADHPLWRQERALVIGHVGGDTTAFPPRARRLVEAQWQRWRSGEPVEYVVRRP